MPRNFPKHLYTYAVLLRKFLPQFFRRNRLFAQKLIHLQSACIFRISSWLILGWASGLLQQNSFTVFESIPQIFFFSRNPKPTSLPSSWVYTTKKQKNVFPRVQSANDSHNNPSARTLAAAQVVQLVIQSNVRINDDSRSRAPPACNS